MGNRLSAIALACCMGIMLWCTTVYYPRFRMDGGNSAFGWDAGGYYWYLPSLVIYHDIADQAWADSMLAKYDFGPKGAAGQGFLAPNGNVVMKYPCGLAVLEAPFFAIGHTLAGILDYPQDGFSRPYQAAIQIGGLLFAFLGLWGLRRFLKAYYPDGIVAAMLLILVIGTNYLNYSTTDNTIAHSWLFTIYVLLLLATRSFHRRATAGNAASIGLLVGVAILIRPTDIIACVIPLLWGLESLSPAALRRHLIGLWERRGKILLAAACAGAVASLQLIYWKAVSGQWIVYSYQDQGFSFRHPHVLEYTFSYRSGWVTYTPVVLLALPGIIHFIRRGCNRVMVVCFLALAYYLVTAWDIWWYAGMGGRAMVQYYPLLAVLMASGLEWLCSGMLSRIAAIPAILLLCCVNIWFMYHAHAGTLYDSDGGMTREYYWRVIGRRTAPPETARLKDGPYLWEGPVPAGARLLFHDSLTYRTPTRADSPLTVQEGLQGKPGVSFMKPEGTLQWLRASAQFESLKAEPETWRSMQFTIRVVKGGAPVRTTMVRPQRFTRRGMPVRVDLDLELPVNEAFDSVQVYFWMNESREKTTVRNLEVHGW